MNRYTLAAFAILAIALIVLLTSEPQPREPEAVAKPKPESNVSRDTGQQERNAKFSK